MNDINTADFLLSPSSARPLALNTIRISPTGKQIVLGLGAGGFVLLLIAPFAYTASGLAPESLIYPASLAFAILIALQIWSWRRLTGSLFDPYIIFLGAAVLFNGSRAILEVFNLNAAGVLGPDASPETTLTTIYLVALGLWCFHLGASFAVSTSPPIQMTASPRININRLRLVGWLLIAIAIVPSAILAGDAITAVLSYGYMVLFQREAATSLNAAPQLLAMFLVPGTLLVAAGSKEKRVHLFIATGLIGLYAATQLFLGARGGAAAAVVPFVWLWHRCIKPVPKSLLLASMALGLVLASIIGMSRHLVGEDRLSPDVMLQIFYSADNPALSAVSEMGFTAKTVAYTTELVPSSRPYDYGMSYALAALTVVPNLFWDVHPALAEGSPATWLVWTIDPWMAQQGGGLGYSFLAEAYLNAGWIGVVLISALLGYALAKVAVWAAKPEDLAKLACAATILAFSIMYARSDSTTIVRGIVWYSIGPYLLVRALTARFSRVRSLLRAKRPQFTRRNAPARNL